MGRRLLKSGVLALLYVWLGAAIAFAGITYTLQATEVCLNEPLNSLFESDCENNMLTVGVDATHPEYGKLLYMCVGLAYLELANKVNPSVF